MAAPECVGTFERTICFEYEHVPVVMYRCKETGLRLAIAKVQSPTVHGYFAVQTEAFDDYGCPHTLEHLIFLGSEKYPYKGVLDVLANRCLAQGTNAWTDTDHTCYTVDTAGSEGFLNILPVYLDHVLFPTLNESGFKTEVHHITGEGSNAGVVYCEMQARENEAGDMIDRAMKMQAYPGRCSYKSETGGRLKELRELTNATVREYHQSYYRPDNLCVIITGQVDFRAACEACAPVVDSIRASDKIKALPAFQKPFSSPVPKPAAPRVEHMEFPAEDEKTGAICMLAWHGPQWEDLETITALSVLMSYLTDDCISPLRKALVETVPPLCGKISSSMYEQSTYLINLKLKSVDVEQLSKRDIDAEISEILQATCAAVDLPRIRSLVGQQRRQHLASVEDSPHDLFSGELIGAFMYAADLGVLQARLDAPSCLDALMAWPAERWQELCSRWLMGPTSSPRVTIIGKPSKACGERIQAEDAARIAAQKEQLGAEGCKAAAASLAEAEKENDVDTPDEVANNFQLPDVGKIQLIDVATVTVNAGRFEKWGSGEVSKVQSLLEQASATGLPAPIFQFDHVSGAQFITCHAMIPLDKLSARSLALLPLWCDVAFELPLAASALGPAMTYEAVVEGLTDSTVSYGMSVGAGGGRFGVGLAANMLSISIKVEKTRYAEGAIWIARILADAEFNAERLQVTAKRMLNAVPDLKRNTPALMSMAMRAMNYRDGCSEGVFNAFRVGKLLATSEDAGELQKACAELGAARAVLLSSPGSIFLRVGGDVLDMGSGHFEVWKRPPFAASAASHGGYGQTEAAKKASALAVAPTAPQFALPRDFLAADALRPSPGCNAGCIVSSSAEESNYWTIQCDAFSDPRSPDLAPLAVALEYLTALEGPFWRKIRGAGFAYSYSLSHNLELGVVRFGLFKATDPVAAYKAACEIVLGLCEEKEGDEAEEPSAGDGARPAKKSKATGDADVDMDAEEGEEEEEEEEDGLDPSALEAAISGVLFGLIEPVDTIPAAMGLAFQNTLQRLPSDQLQWLLKEVQGVTTESVQDALRTHVLPLFTGSKGRTVSVACPTSKRVQLQAGLLELDPPFKLAHFEVEELVKTLAPEDGFAGLRAQVRKAAE
ncbi:unnamed protein product [Polarella glacialis]|uniref:Mitochondrial presequence protease n=1 Tax=Polarella glacialis TaxID=89957 RepID=A0A813JPY3_POLGL|nr:unnamed protein product [Polarella glacialis]